MINFGAGYLICVPTVDATGAAIANPTPVRLGTLQDVSVDLSGDIKTLYGQGQFPIAAGRGKANTSIKAKMAEINGAILGSLFYGRNGSAAIKDMVVDFVAQVPASSTYTVQVVPPNTGTFVSNMGIIDVTSGKPMTRVASAPAAGQYTVNASGLYTFAAGDASHNLLISYEYSATSTTGQVFALQGDPMGNMPVFSMILKNAYAGESMILKLNRCVSSKLSIPLKNDDFAVGDMEITAFTDAANQLGYICLF